MIVWQGQQFGKSQKQSIVINQIIIITANIADGIE